jgi:hypothetical protein
MSDDPLYLEIPKRSVSVDHYPMPEGMVVVRWRGEDNGGYIVEANIGGCILWSGGHGDGLAAARAAGKAVRAALTPAAAPSEGGER